MYHVANFPLISIQYLKIYRSFILKQLLCRSLYFKADHNIWRRMFAGIRKHFIHSDSELLWMYDANNFSFVWRTVQREHLKLLKYKRAYFPKSYFNSKFKVHFENLQTWVFNNWNVKWYSTRFFSCIRKKINLNSTVYLKCTSKDL